MKDKGLLFKTDMVQAIDKNLKTMTRRLEGLKGINENPGDYKFNGFTSYAGISKAIFIHKNDYIEIKCPYQIGQKLWVRETWNILKLNVIAYKADDKSRYKHIKWKSPLFMPKKYARLWLEVVDIRIERLQDINVDDIEEEGLKSLIKWTDDKLAFYWKIGKIVTDDIEEAWRLLWDSIHKTGYTWDLNPWLWVITFKRIKHENI